MAVLTLCINFLCFLEVFLDVSWLITIASICRHYVDHLLVRHYRDNPLDASASASGRVVVLKDVFAGVCSGRLSRRNSGFRSRDKQIVFDQWAKGEIGSTRREEKAKGWGRLQKGWKKRCRVLRGYYTKNYSASLVC